MLKSGGVLFLFLVSSVSQGQFMPFGFWKTQVSDGSNPCVSASATVGMSCGDGTIYIGNDSSGYKLVTPFGDCGYEPSGSSSSTATAVFTPSCSGSTDSMTKIWMNPTSFLGATSVTDGAANTNLIVMSSPQNSPAASYCYYMNYASRSDWYLPSKNELNLFYTNKAALIANSKMGLEVSVNQYWSSSEYNSSFPANAYHQTFNTGSASAFAKTTAERVRCIRRLGPYFMASLSAPEDFQDNLVVTGLDYDSATVPTSTSQVIVIKNSGELDAAGVTVTVSAGFSIVGGTCNSGVPLVRDGTCTIEILPTATDRGPAGIFAGSLIVSTGAISAQIELQGSTVTAMDPCLAANPPVGTSCLDGSIYIGKNTGGEKLVTTVGGCGHEASGSSSTSPSADFTPGCSGTDAMTKNWGPASSFPTPTVTGATSATDGAANTDILGAISDTHAGRYCYYLVHAGHSDWYLPAKNELNLFYTNLSAINSNTNGRLSTAQYWSSTESTYQQAYYQSLTVPGTSSGAVKTGARLVRCIRKY